MRSLVRNTLFTVFTVLFFSSLSECSVTASITTNSGATYTISRDVTLALSI